MDGESLRCNVVVMDKTLQRKAGENEESVPEPKRVCTTREVLGPLWVHIEVSRMGVDAQRNRKTSTDRKLQDEG